MSLISGDLHSKLQKEVMVVDDVNVSLCRKVFPELLRLTGKMRTWSYMPAALAMTVPASLCGQLHQFIVNDIALQETPCSVCVETRATAYQVACGALLPWVAPLPGFILLGKEMSWKWVPHPRASWQEWGKMYYNIFNKSSKMLVGVTVVQMLVAGGLVWAETRDYWSVMDELERRIEEEDRLIEEKKRRKEEKEIFK